MTDVLMKMIGCEKKILTHRPFVGEYIIDKGMEFRVDKVTLTSGGDLVVVSVTPEVHIIEYDLFNKYYWNEV